VIDIEASAGDPHQADARYYRRHSSNKHVMEHYVDKRIEAQHPSYDGLAATLIDGNHVIPYRLSFYPEK
jgi:hypothetical protein